MTAGSTLDQMAFRNAMARFASGVTVVTTHEEEGKPVAFTASAFSSLSLDPPLILVCLDKKADSHQAFTVASHFAVSILASGQSDHAMRFATKGTDKFAGAAVHPGTVTGLPLVEQAVVHLECKVHDRLEGGDHTIILGEVVSADSNDQPPLLHFNRQFGRFQPE
jgi:flavin reductase ActVB